MDMRHENKTNIISWGLVDGQLQAIGSITSLAAKN